MFLLSLPVFRLSDGISSEPADTVQQKSVGQVGNLQKRHFAMQDGVNTATPLLQ